MIAQTYTFNAVLSDFPQQYVQITSNILVSFGQVCGKTLIRPLLLNALQFERCKSCQWVGSSACDLPRPMPTGQHQPSQRSGALPSDPKVAAAIE